MESESHNHNPNLVSVDEVELIKGTFNWGPMISIASILFFYATKTFVINVVLPPPKNARAQGSVTIWKWTNLVNSALHSFITGGGSLLW